MTTKSARIIIMIQKEMQYYKEMLDKKPLSYMSFPAEARDDRELANYALEKNPFNMWYISDRLKNDKSYAMEVLSTYPTFHLNKLSEKLQNDKEMVMFAMKRNQTYDLADLEHTCQRFSDDKEVMDLAVERLKENPMLVPGELQIARAMIAGYLGKEHAIQAVSDEPALYRLLRGDFKEDSKIALTAIKNQPDLINDVPKNLQNINFYTTAIMAVPQAKAELSLAQQKEVDAAIEKLNKPSLNAIIAEAKDTASKRAKETKEATSIDAR